MNPMPHLAVSGFRFIQLGLYLNYLKVRYKGREIAYAIPPVRAVQFVTLLFIRVVFKI